MVSAWQEHCQHYFDSSRIAGKCDPDGPRFLVAYGSRDSHALTLSSGEPNRSRKAGLPYDSVSWEDIRRRLDAPTCVEKDDAPLIVLSTYREADGRTSEGQQEHGEFWGLAIDIDEGSPSLDKVLDAVQAAAPGATVLIYSSSSAGPEKLKWRALLPLVAPIHGSDYRDTQRALFAIVADRGVLCDEALRTPNQPIYLPNVPPARRGPDGRPRFYVAKVIEGRPLDLAADNPIVVRREQMRAAEIAEQEERERRAVEARKRYIASGGEAFDPIADFEAKTTIRERLGQYGFKPHPRRRDDWKRPLSENGNYTTRDFGTHWVVVSAWASECGVGREGRNGHRWGTAFDLYVAFEHDGSRERAIMAHVEAARPDLFAALQADEQRRRDFLAWATAGRRLGGAADVERPADPGPVRTLDEIRRDIARGMRRAMNQPGIVHLFRPPTGTGKTTMVLEAAHVMREEAAARAYEGDTAAPTAIAMALPTHANVREVEAAARGVGLRPAAFPERTERNCGQFEQATRAAAMGLNAYASTCIPCELRARCEESGYLAAVKAASGASFRIGTADRAAVSGKMTADARWVILDESPTKALAPTFTASVADVLDVLRWGARIQSELRLDRGRVVEADPEQRAFAEAIVEVAGRIADASAGLRLQEHPLTPKQEAEAKAEKDAEIRRREAEHDQALRRLSEAKAVSVRVAGSVKECERQVRRAKAALNRARGRGLHEFPSGRPRVEFVGYPPGRVVAVDIPPQTTAPEGWERMVLRWAERYGVGAGISPTARKIIMLAATGGLDRLYVVQGDDDDAAYAIAVARTAIAPDATIVALDATADAEALRAMTGREVIDHTPQGHPRLIHRAIQYPIDVTASTSPREAAGIVEGIIGEFPDRVRVGVIGWRRVVQGLAIKGALTAAARGRIVKTSYFGEGPDRGSNDWIRPVEEGGAGCDLVIVLGTFRPGEEPVRQALIVMGDLDAANRDGDWGPRRWEGRREDGSAVVVEGAGYRDPSWHKAFCLIARSMTLQNIGRGRATLPEGCAVAAVTAEPTGLPLAEPLAVLEAEVRGTVEAARSAVSFYSSIRTNCAFGWTPTVHLVTTLCAPGTVRPKGLGKRAAVARIERAVAAGLLIRAPKRGWFGIAGACDPWPTPTVEVVEITPRAAPVHRFEVPSPKPQEVSHGHG